MTQNHVDAEFEPKNAITTTVAPTADAVRDLLALLGADASGSEWEIISSGSHRSFWMPEAGRFIHGFVESRKEIETRIGPCGLYTIRMLSGSETLTPDGEVVRSEAGSIVSVLERTGLQGLRSCIGREVGILCEGMVQTRKGNPFMSFFITAKNGGAAMKTMPSPAMES